ncbi:MAG: hypothetical protein M3Z65_02675 [Chloroflexota bacterium]|nr:hypothetical protein [Chloroflexota bacterium]
MTRNKWLVAVAGGAFGTALIGGVALAGFQPFGASDGAVVGGPGAAPAERDVPKDRLKTILDALVAKNTITQAQADAIQQAMADAAAAAPKPSVPNPNGLRPGRTDVKSFLGDLTKAASDYLGMDLKTLATEMRNGKSAADIANGLGAQGKNSQGLTAALITAANARVDQAAAANRLTADQAAALKPKLGTEITAFVQRSFTKPGLPRPLNNAKPSGPPKP